MTRSNSTRRANPNIIFFVALATVLPVVVQAQSGPDAARAYREANEPGLVRDFAELLSYPNWAFTPQIREAASYIRDEMRAVGVDTELLEIEGASPLILGELRVPGATRTLGIYVHYDGQPVDIRNWTHNPFNPTLYTRAMEAGGEEISLPEDGEEVDPEWRIYARSAGDDKAPIAAILPVLRSFAESGITPTSNLIFMFDGEEEAGSRNLAQYMEMASDVLEEIDIWLFFDGPAHVSGRRRVTCTN